MFPSETTVGAGEVTPALIDTWIAALARSTGPADDATRIDTLDRLRQLTNTADGLTTTITAEIARTHRTTTQLPEKAQRVDRSIATRIGMARRESPHRAHRRIALAMVLTTDMPHTYTALRTGRIDEWRATIITRETAYLSREDRGKIDTRIGADLDRLETLSVRRLEKEIRGWAYEADRETFVRTRAAAAKNRQVSLRPLPDGMARLSATVPLVQGVAAYASLIRAADTAKATGDDRSRGAIMVDTLLHRITGGGTTPTPTGPASVTHTGPDDATGATIPAALANPAAAASTPAAASAPVVPIAVTLVISDATLLAGGNEPAQCGEYGPVPAELARELILAADAEGLATLRRIYTAPTGITAMESTARCFPPGLARMIRIRDRTCRMPYCDAPIRHIDHIRPVADGGPTTFTNGQGLCEACNHAKQAHGWTTRVTHPTGHGHPPDHSHTVETTTPTGHTHHSTAPPPPQPLESGRTPEPGRTPGPQPTRAPA